jgi:hypothetical protein
MQSANFVDAKTLTLQRWYELLFSPMRLAAGPAPFVFLFWTTFGERRIGAHSRVPRLRVQNWCAGFTKPLV